MYGGYGDDQMVGENGSDESTASGERRHRRVELGPYYSVPNAAEVAPSNDTLYGENGNDKIYGGDGDDGSGGWDNDQMYGEDGNDKMCGASRTARPSRPGSPTTIPCTAGTGTTPCGAGGRGLALRRGR